MATAMDHVQVLVDKIGPRPVSTEEEGQAAQYVAQSLIDMGLDVDIDEFATPTGVRWPYVIAFFLAIIGIIMSGIGTLAPSIGVTLSALGLILTIVGWFLYHSEHSGHPLLSRMRTNGISQNVVARYLPESASRERRRRRIVILAHTDTVRAEFAGSPNVVKHLPLIKKIISYIMPVLPVLALLRLLPLPWPDVVDLILWIIALIGCVVLLLAALDIIAHRFMSFISGANDNASGVAVMLAAAKGILDPQESAKRKQMKEQRQAQDALINQAAGELDNSALQADIPLDTGFSQDPAATGVIFDNAAAAQDPDATGVISVGEGSQAALPNNAAAGLGANAQSDVLQNGAATAQSVSAETGVMQPVGGVGGQQNLSDTSAMQMPASTQAQNSVSGAEAAQGAQAAADLQNTQAMQAVQAGSAAQTGAVDAGVQAGAAMQAGAAHAPQTTQSKKKNITSYGTASKKSNLPSWYTAGKRKAEQEAEAEAAEIEEKKKTESKKGEKKPVRSRFADVPCGDEASQKAAAEEEKRIQQEKEAAELAAKQAAQQAAAHAAQREAEIAAQKLKAQRQAELQQQAGQGAQMPATPTAAVAGAQQAIDPSEKTTQLKPVGNEQAAGGAGAQQSAGAQQGGQTAGSLNNLDELVGIDESIDDMLFDSSQKEESKAESSASTSSASTAKEETSEKKEKLAENKAEQGEKADKAGGKSSPEQPSAEKPSASSSKVESSEKEKDVPQANKQDKAGEPSKSDAAAKTSADGEESKPEQTSKPASKASKEGAESKRESAAKNSDSQKSADKVKDKGASKEASKDADKDAAKNAASLKDEQEDGLSAISVDDIPEKSKNKPQGKGAEGSHDDSANNKAASNKASKEADKTAQADEESKNQDKNAKRESLLKGLSSLLPSIGNSEKQDAGAKDEKSASNFSERQPKGRNAKKEMVAKPKRQLRSQADKRKPSKRKVDENFKPTVAPTGDELEAHALSQSRQVAAVTSVYEDTPQSGHSGFDEGASSADSLQNDPMLSGRMPAVNSDDSNIVGAASRNNFPTLTGSFPAIDPGTGTFKPVKASKDVAALDEQNFVSSAQPSDNEDTLSDDLFAPRQDSVDFNMQESRFHNAVDGVTGIFKRFGRRKKKKDKGDDELFSKGGGDDLWGEDDWKGGSYFNGSSSSSDDDLGFDEIASVANKASETEPEESKQEATSFGSEAISAAKKRAAEIRESVMNMAASDNTVEKEIWFVGLGASSAGNHGMKNFLELHAGELRGALIINLEAVGAGEISYLSTEGCGNIHRSDRRLQTLTRQATQDILGHEARSQKMEWRDTDATPALVAGMRAITIMGIDDVAPVGWHWTTDTLELVEEEQLEQATDIVLDIIDNV